MLKSNSSQNGFIIFMIALNNGTLKAGNISTQAVGGYEIKHDGKTGNLRMVFSEY